MLEIVSKPPHYKLMQNMATTVFATTVAAMFFGAGSSHAQIREDDTAAVQIGQAKTVQSSPTPFTTVAEQCIVPAANFHGLNPWLLRAVLRVESSLKPDAIGRNKNGTFDIGIGQINSMHLPELRKFGIEQGHLTDACVGTYVSGWLIKKAIAKRGYTWEGVASYHSSTPALNQRYQEILIKELQHSQAPKKTSELVPTPMQPRSHVKQREFDQVPQKGVRQQISSAKNAAAEEEILIFDQPR